MCDSGLGLHDQNQHHHLLSIDIFTMHVIWSLRDMLLLRLCNRCESLLNIKIFQVRFFSTQVMAVSKENEEVLQMLGIHKNKYKKALPKKRTIRELNLEKVVRMLTKLGFTAKDIQKQPNILKLNPQLIDHRFKLLEECGVETRKITLARISKFARLNKSLIKDLKKTDFIPKNIDVAHNILSYSDIPRELYPSETSDEESVVNAQTVALQTYISWKFGLSMEEVKDKFVSYEHLHEKSIRLVMQCYDVLINQVRLSENKIKMNMFLLHHHPDNFLEVIENLPKLGNLPIQDVASATPKILMRPLDKLLRVMEILKKYNVPEEGLEKYASVLTLSPETVAERCAALHSDPVFRPFFCSPRICFMIYRYHTTRSRSQLLAELKWRCLSISLVTNISQDFKKRIEMGHDQSGGTDILHYLKKHLGYENKALRQKLKLHPFYFLVPLSSISETVPLLLESGIGKSDIFSALPIVLYPKEKVERWLQQVYDQPEVQSLRDEQGKLNPSIILHLVLYYIERPYGFSGNGVWSEEDVATSPSLQ